MHSTLAALFALAAFTNAIPIDNGVEGEPEIECGPTAISVNFNTKNNFEGHVYVKNRFAEEGCRTTDGGRRVTGISLDFTTCGVARERSANPRGVFVTTTVVITFHPRFITKVDRAYTIQCFYMEADKTVSTQIEVSMITTAFQTEVVPMPVCRYEILDGAPTGPVIHFAIIGQPVYHKWICDTDTVDTFCMQVHSCTVDDGNGDTLELIDANGCATDRNLLDNLDYTGDLMAGKESHVFKYADRPALFYTCQITILIKEPNSQCPVPQCPEAPATFGRKKREANMNDVAVVDVSTGNVEVLDITPYENALPTFSQLNQHQIKHNMIETDVGVCLTTTGFAFLLSVLAGSVALALFGVYSCVTHSQKQ